MVDTVLAFFAVSGIIAWMVIVSLVVNFCLDHNADFPLHRKDDNG